MRTQLKKPDLGAPRFRPTRYNVLSSDLLKRFREKFPQYKTIPDSKLREIISVFNQQIWENAVNSRDGAEFPENLGYIFVGSCPTPRKFNADFNASHEKGVAIRHRNFESDNFLAKIFYTNYANKYKFQHRDLWQFKGHRDFTRKVSEVYPQNWKIYVQVDNFAKISRMYKKSFRTKAVLSKREESIPEFYNEFEMN